jgi:hypothetical protein
MNPLAAPTVEMVLDNVTDATVAPLVSKIAEFAARLDEIDEAIGETAKSGPTKAEILAAAPADMAQIYARMAQELKDFYKEIFVEVTGDAPRDETDGLVAEAKELHLQNLRLCKTLEETFQIAGIVNAVYNVISKPEGAGIRKQYKGYAGYVS